MLDLNICISQYIQKSLVENNSSRIRSNIMMIMGVKIIKLALIVIIEKILSGRSND